jgi:ArsR family transcriptional regulator
VGDLMEATGLAQANASRHLQTLSDAGILKRRKQGIHVLYSIADPNIFRLCEHVCGSLQNRYAARSKAFTS